VLTPASGDLQCCTHISTHHTPVRSPKGVHLQSLESCSANYGVSSLLHPHHYVAQSRDSVDFKNLQAIASVCGSCTTITHFRGLVGGSPLPEALNLNWLHRRSGTLRLHFAVRQFRRSARAEASSGGFGGYRVAITSRRCAYGPSNLKAARERCSIQVSRACAIPLITRRLDAPPSRPCPAAREYAPAKLVRRATVSTTPGLRFRQA
jgi:hypothetical protein